MERVVGEAKEVMHEEAGVAEEMGLREGDGTRSRRCEGCEKPSLQGA